MIAIIRKQVILSCFKASAFAAFLVILKSEHSINSLGCKTFFNGALHSHDMLMMVLLSLNHGVKDFFFL